MPYKTLIIDDNTHKKLKEYCKKNNLKINEYVNNLIEDSLFAGDKSVLPMALKNNKGEIIESIICNSISSEYKNNMPKEITLMRKSNDGSGFIGNYNLK